MREMQRLGFEPWVRKIPWSRKWQPTSVLFLENAMDRGAWRAIVNGVTKNQIRLNIHMSCILFLVGQKVYLGFSLKSYEEPKQIFWPTQHMVSMMRRKLHLLHWQVGSLPLSHQGSYYLYIATTKIFPHTYFATSWINYFPLELMCQSLKLPFLVVKDTYNF